MEGGGASRRKIRGGKMLNLTGVTVASRCGRRDVEMKDHWLDGDFSSSAVEKFNSADYYDKDDMMAAMHIRANELRKRGYKVTMWRKKNIYALFVGI